MTKTLLQETVSSWIRDKYEIPDRTKHILNPREIQRGADAGWQDDAVLT